MTVTELNFRVVSAGTRVAASFLGGVLIAVFANRYAPSGFTLLAGWDAAALIFLIWTLASLHGATHQQTASLATREDPAHPVADLLLVLASVASLGAVGALMVQAGRTAGTARDWLVALGLLSVVISWLLVHTVYMLKYARLYYKHNSGIDFYGSTPPAYSDFAYIAFTIGMTFQVSDNNFTSNEFRRTALRHALLSFLFGTIILATLVNFMAGLGK